MTSVKEMLDSANSTVRSIDVNEAKELLEEGDVTFIDVRDSEELERDGKIPGAVHVSRGMLEFRIDPSTPYHNPVFAPNKQLVFYCASGGRSALAAKTAQSMGISSVANLKGGFKGWKEAAAPVEKVTPKAA